MHALSQWLLLCFVADLEACCCSRQQRGSAVSEAALLLAGVTGRAAAVLSAMQRLNLRRMLWAYCCFVLGWPALLMVALGGGELEHIAAAFGEPSRSRERPARGTRLVILPS